MQTGRHPQLTFEAFFAKPVGYGHFAFCGIVDTAAACQRGRAANLLVAPVRPLPPRPGSLSSTVFQRGSDLHWPKTDRHMGPSCAVMVSFPANVSALVAIASVNMADDYAGLLAHRKGYCGPSDISHAKFNSLFLNR
jgi:hypothetical protein